MNAEGVIDLHSGLGELSDLTIAIYDDNDEEAQTLEIDLGDLGVGHVVVVPTEHRKLDDALRAVRDSANAAVCDQVLRVQAGAEFSGAQLVTELVAANTPSVLITAFAADVGMEIRPYLPKVPSFLRRSELSDDPASVLDELENCRLELLQGRPAHREAFRTPIYIEKSTAINGEYALDARIGSWQLDEVIQFPARMLGENWANDPEAAVGEIFFAHVNLAARKPDELFLESLEPEPVDLQEAELHFS
jgi:hypothetical protein